MRFCSTLLLAVCAMLFIPVISLSATDAEANQIIQEAARLREKKSFKKAAETYMKAVLMADSTVVKANSLISATVCYRNAKLYGKEFDCIERLLKEHIAQVNFQRAVERQYEIADDFFKGHRDTAVAWLPFIKDADRTVEFYEKALKNASCAKEAPEAKLRLGRIYQEQNKAEKAIVLFREILTMHAESEAARYAGLELIHTYIYLARGGDGDGAWSKLAIAALKDFLEKHPNDPEVPWAKQSLEEINRLEAKRLHAIGEYYHRTGRDDLAERYLARVIRDYGATENSVASERLLAKINKKYTPPAANAPRKQKYAYTFQRNTIPLEREPILTVPENSDGKWLLPVQNLKHNVAVDANDKVPERKVDKNEF